MLTSGILNSSAGAEDVAQVVNNTNILDVLTNNSYGLITQYRSLHREWTLLFMTLMSALGNVIALIFHSFNLSGRLESAFCIAHILFMGLLVGYIPMLTQTAYETNNFSIFFGKYFHCEPLEFIRIYFLTLSSYMLVVLILNCYSIVIRRLFVSPASFRKVISTVICFYSVCALPSLFIAYLHKFLGREIVDGCVPYFFLPKEYSNDHYKIYMGVILFLVYIVPFCLIVILLSKMFFEFQTKYYKNKESKLLLSKSDSKFIEMTVMMSVAYIVANIPFVVQGIVIMFIDSNIIDTDIAFFIEIISISNTCLNPYIYMMVEEKFVCSPWGFFHLWNNKSALNAKEKEFYHCCYEPVSSDACKECSIKPIKEISQSEAAPIVFTV